MGCMAKSDPSDVARRIRGVMKKLALSTNEFAMLLGVRRNAVSNWINGYNLPAVEQAYEIVKLLPGVTMEWLYLGDDGMVPKSLAIQLQTFTMADELGVEVPEVPPEPEAPRPTRAPGRPRRQASRKRATAN